MVRGRTFSSRVPSAAAARMACWVVSSSSVTNFLFHKQQCRKEMPINKYTAILTSYPNSTPKANPNLFFFLSSYFLRGKRLCFRNSRGCGGREGGGCGVGAEHNITCAFESNASSSLSCCFLLLSFGFCGRACLMPFWGLFFDLFCRRD